MVQFTVDQRVLIVSKYLETKSYAAVIEAFTQRFPDRRPPSNMTIHRNVAKYLANGTSLNLNKIRSGRPRSARTPENIEAVRELLLDQPTVSVRRNPLALSRATFNRIVKNDIKWHPFKMHIRHELKERDFARRLNFCRWFLERCYNHRFLYNVIIGDEATFSLNGKVNNHNVRMYAPKGDPPSFNYDVNNGRQKVTVWAGMCGNGTLLGPFFFEGNVTGRVYLELFNENIFPALIRSYGIDQNDLINNLWWAQDGAPAHRTIVVRNRLSRVFGRRVIAIGHEVEWPARSPDLTPCDYFLWGYLKSKVFSTPPENIEILRQRIVENCQELRQTDFIFKAHRSMRERARLCIDRNGQHVEGF